MIEPLLPTDVRGKERMDDRRVLNGISWRLRTGAPWADIPARYGPYTTCGNRFRRWSVVPRASSVQRSRATRRICGSRRSHTASVAAKRSGSRLRGRRHSMSMTMVP